MAHSRNTKATSLSLDELYFATMLCDYEQSLMAANRSNKTITWYMEILRRYNRYLILQELNKQIYETGKDELRSYIRHLQNTVRWADKTNSKNSQGKLSPYSVQGHVRAIKAFFSWLEREGHIERNPIAKFPLPAVPQNMVKTLTQEQINGLLQGVSRNTPLGAKYYLLLFLLLDTGMRISELVNIELKNIDFAQGLIRIRGKGEKERTVPICNQTRKELLKYIKTCRPLCCPEDSPYLFPKSDGNHISINGVQQFIRRLAARQGLAGIKCSPHIFRHTFASQSIANEANVFVLRDIMGHSSLQTTLKYTHLNPGDLKLQHTKFSPVANLNRKNS